jgi:hypothetical protein
MEEIMEIKLLEKAGKKFVELVPGKTILRNEQDTVDLIGLCGENGTNRVMFHAENLTPEFFDLSTRVAGDMLQKFVNYYMKVAAVITPDYIKSARFKEMVMETNYSNEFRVFSDRDKAETWLTDK